MNLLELRLTAFGPFTDRVLSFVRGTNGASHARGLHLIYGPNEAGKSTALRAVTALLYGMEHPHARDAHLHRGPELRLGARLRCDDGRELNIVRRKGLTKTLLDQDGQPFEEKLLRDVLGGASRALFVSMFGLDHETLRRGADALLAGGGGAGESLFDASTGGVATHALLKALRQEADALYRPRARTSQIQQGLKHYREARKESREQMLSADSWAKQREAVSKAREHRDALREALGAIELRRVRLTRVASALPLTVRRAALVQEREQLGNVPELPPDAKERREQAEKILDNVAHELAHNDQALARVVERLAVLEVPQDLAALREEDADALRKAIRGRRLATEGQADLERERRRMGREIEELGARLSGATSAGCQGELPRISDADLGNLERLVSAYERGLERVAGDRKRLGVLERKRQALLEAAKEAVVQGTGELELFEQVLARAERLGDSDERRLAAELREKACLERAETLRAALPGFDGSLTDLAAASIPNQTTVTRYEREWGALRAKGEAQAQVERTCAARLAENVAALGELERGGEVPSPAELLVIRAHRQTGWQSLKLRLLEGRRDAAQSGASPRVAESEERLTAWAGDVRPVEAFEEAMANADRYADLLLDETQRVHRKQSLLEERAELRAQCAADERVRQTLDAEVRALEQRWQSEWAETGVEPRSPEEMTEWCLARREVVALLDQAHQHAEEAREVRRLQAELQGSLVGAAPALGEALDDAETGRGESSFSMVLDRARALAQSWRRTQAERVERERALGALDEACTEAEQAVGAGESDLRGLRLEWSASLKQVDIVSSDTLEALGHGARTLQLIRQLAALQAQLAQAEARSDQLAFQVESSEQVLRRTLGRHAADLALADGSSLDDRGDALLDRYYRTSAQLEERRQQEKLRSELQTRRGELEVTLKRGQKSLRACMTAAGVEDAHQLREVEAASERARQLETQLSDLNAQLLSVAEGRPVETLLEDVRDADADEVRAQLLAATEEREAVQEDMAAAHHQVGSLEAGLERYEQADGAAFAASEAATHAAALSRLVQRYVRTRLATRLLEDEVERYREAHQGPVVARAATLMRAITGGAFSEVRVDFNDRDALVLQCVRAGGQPVGVEGLSDGTRDQLYLALRLASFEQYIASNESLPLVLDDVFVHFDDRRTRHALEVLGEVAGEAQLLLFTHHERVRELAEQAIPQSRLAVHTLNPVELAASAGSLADRRSA